MTVEEKLLKDEMELNFALGDYMPLQPVTFTDYGEHSLKMANKKRRPIRPTIRHFRK